MIDVFQRLRPYHPAAPYPILSTANAHYALINANAELPRRGNTTLALFLAAELLIPRQNHFIAQSAWLSIGYSIGAAVGVSVVLPESERALVLIGDGGFQMVAQAFATLVKLRKGTIVVVFDNALYAIEQFLVNAMYFAPGSARDADFFCELGLDRDAAQHAAGERRWNYEALAEAFGGVGIEVDTPESLAKALGEARARADVPTLIAARIQPRSLPPELEAVLRQTAPSAAFPTLAAPPAPAGGFSPEGFN